MKNLYFDLETTGTSWFENGIHQISGIVEIDGNVVEKFDLRVQPNPSCKIEDEALAVSGITRKDLGGYMPFEDGYKTLIDILKKHCDKYDKLDKFHLVGYNNAGFDNGFLRQFFMQNGDKYFNSWFWIDTLDCMVLASQAFRKVRHKIPDFKLPTIAKGLGIEVDMDKLHDAMYDVELTREVYLKLCKN
jgi:DNA polymerase-3 subunit epsilon